MKPHRSLLLLLAALLLAAVLPQGSKASLNLFPDTTVTPGFSLALSPDSTYWVLSDVETDTVTLTFRRTERKVGTTELYLTFDYAVTADVDTLLLKYGTRSLAVAEALQGPDAATEPDSPSGDEETAAPGEGDEEEQSPADDEETASPGEADQDPSSPADDEAAPASEDDDEQEATPETPESPEDPEDPEDPENPETPETPADPETPEPPADPETPDQPGEPGEDLSPEWRTFGLFASAIVKPRETNIARLFNITIPVPGPGFELRLRNPRLTVDPEDYDPDTDPYAPSDYEADLMASVLALNLPVVVVNTVGREEPTGEPIYHPEGSMGIGLTNATKVPGAVQVILPDSTVVFDSGEYVKKQSGMTIKWRGNTSALSDQKPYKIKLQKKGDMMGRGDDLKRDKNWVLISDNLHKQRNGYLVSELVGQPWSPAFMQVNLVMNGDYRGVYMLVEGVERNQDCRVDVDESGFIAEFDPYWWNEDGYYLHSKWLPRYGYTFKHPELDEIADDDPEGAPERIAYIQDQLHLMEESFVTDRYPEVIDVESAARWLLGHDILGTSDRGGSNRFFTKKDNTDSTLIAFGPMWDFDSSEKTPGDWSTARNGEFCLEMLENESCDAFILAYRRLWTQLKPYIFDSLIAWLNTYYYSDEAKAFTASMRLHQNRWGTSYTATSITSRALKWFRERSTFMNDNIETLGPDDSSLADAPASRSAVAVSGLEVAVTGLAPGQAAALLAPSGHIAAQGTGPDCRLTAPAPGIYLLRIDGERPRKLMLH